MEFFIKLKNKKPLNQQNLENKQVVEKAINEHEVEIVLKHFDELGLEKDEIKKFTPTEIATLSKAYKPNLKGYPWGENKEEAIILSKKKLATWGNYDIYASKLFYVRTYDKKKTAVLANHLIITGKDGKAIATLYYKDKIPDLNKLQGIVVVFNDNSDWIRNVKKTSFLNECTITFDKWNKISLFSKEGKFTTLFYEKISTEEEKFDISTCFLTKNDKIIKNDTTPIYTMFNIDNFGKMTQEGNWKLSAEGGEILGKVKGNVKDDFKDKHVPTFDATRNYADIQNYAETLGQTFNLALDEEVPDLATTDDDIHAEFMSAQVDTKTGKTNLQIAVFATVRKKEIINAKGEVEEVKFYDKNNTELVADNVIKHELEVRGNPLSLCEFSGHHSN